MQQINDYSPEGVLDIIKSLFSKKKKGEAVEIIQPKVEGVLDTKATVEAIRKAQGGYKTDTIVLAPTFAALTLDSKNLTTPPKDISSLIRRLESFVREAKNINSKIKSKVKPIDDLERKIFDHKRPNWDDPNTVIPDTRRLADMVAKLGNVSQLFPSEQQFPLMGVKDGNPIKYNQPLTLTSPTSMELNRLVGISSELIDLMTDTYELPSLPLVDLTDPPYRGFFVSRFANEIEYEYDGDPEDELSHIRGIYNGDDTAERNSELEYDYTEGVSYSSFQASKLVDKIIELTAQVHGVAPIYVQK